MEIIEAFSEAHEHFESLGGYTAEAEARRLAAGLGLAAGPTRPARRRAVRRRAAPPGADPHPVRRQRAAAAGRADQPPGRRRTRLAARLPAVLPWRPGGDQPRPGPARRRDHQGAAPGPRGRGRSWRRWSSTAATTRPYLTAREVEEERVGELAERQDEGDHPAVTAGRRHAWPVRQARPGRQGPRRTRRPARGGEGQRSRAPTHHLGAPARPARVGPHGARGTRRWRSPTATLTVFDDVTFDIGRGERMLIMGLNGAGKTTLAEAARRPPRARPGQVVSGRRTSIGYYAQEHEGIESRPSRCWSTCAASAPIGDKEARAVMGMFGLSGRQGVPGRRHPVGRREDQARARPAGGRWAQPAAARRADQQPGPDVAHRGRRGAGGLARHDHPGEPRPRVRPGAAPRPGADHARGPGRPLRRVDAGARELA